MTAISESVPSETDKRELAYTMLYGAKRLRAELLALVQDAAVLRHKSGDDDGA